MNLSYCITVLLCVYKIECLFILLVAYSPPKMPNAIAHDAILNDLFFSEPHNFFTVDKTGFIPLQIEAAVC